MNHTGRRARRIATAAAAGMLIVSLALAGCSDAAVRDLPQAQAVLARDGADADDARIAKTLRPLMENVPRVGDVPITADDYVAAVEAGTWPGRDQGWPEGDDPHSPRLWVRLARFAEEWAKAETGEDWETIGFTYPFPQGSPLPTKRDSETHVDTTLICRSLGHQGCVVQVPYYRWTSEPGIGFLEAPDKAKAKMDKARAENRKIASAAPAGWRVLGTGESGTWVMPPGNAPDDPVPTSVIEAATNAGREIHRIDLADSLDLVLVPNDMREEGVPLAEAEEMLLTGAYRVDRADLPLGDDGMPEGTRNVGRSWDTPGEAFEAAGFDMVFPAEIGGAAAQDYQTLDGKEGKILSVEYWKGGMGTLIADAIVRKERGTEVSLGNYAGHSEHSATVDMDGVPAKVDGDSKLTRARWSTTDDKGTQWAYSVVVWQPLSDDEILGIARQVR